MSEITTDPAAYAKSKSAKLTFGKVPVAKDQVDNDCGIYAMYIGLSARARASGGAAPILPRAQSADKSAHWGLVFGYWEDGGKVPYVLATHWGKYWEWKAADLAKSNACINDWTDTLYEKTGPHDWNPVKSAGGKKETRMIPSAPLSKT